MLETSAAVGHMASILSGTRAAESAKDASDKVGPTRQAREPDPMGDEAIGFVRKHSATGGGHMRHLAWRFSGAIVAISCAVLVVPSPVRGQASKGSASKWTPPRTADGQPNIQGMWNSEGSFYAPLQRPANLGEKSNFTDAELKAILQESVDTKIENSDRGTGAGPTHWYEPRKEKTNYSVNWLLKDPADGRIPAMTQWAKEKLAYTREHQYDSWEFFDPGDRCIFRGILGNMLPTFYNNGKQILQAPGYVMIFNEMIHDARVIPIDGRPHVGPAIRTWQGDARGRWEGNTLTVETTNFRATDVMRNLGLNSEKLRIVERFTPVGPDTLNYEVTIDDPVVYTRPWTIAFPFERDNKYTIFEYACHEGNYAIPNSLSGARAQEKGTGERKRPQ